ncbi:hypothetical protein KBD71_01190 [Candidatus Woesebacteria bacterium]|nr:hypothetical protein [Candidatus Woesebacteria bacterium]
MATPKDIREVGELVSLHMDEVKHSGDASVAWAGGMMWALSLLETDDLISERIATQDIDIDMMIARLENKFPNIFIRD